MENGMKSTTLTLIASLFLAPQLPALAADDNGHVMPAEQAKDRVWTDGTVKRINPNIGKITVNNVRLAQLANLDNPDMPALALMFRVTDPAWLDQIKPGDRIRFVVERLDGALTITALQPGR